MRGLVVCDVDNTICDALSMLARKFPEYNPRSQVRYQFARPEYLESFSDPMFYRGFQVNNSVLNFLEYHACEGFNIRFISASPNQAVHVQKEHELRALFGSLTVLENVPFGDDLNVVRSFGTGNLVFVDDAPSRLMALRQLGAPFVPVEHLYNQEFHTGRRLLVPNYLM